uniref:Uncharacterized protein n=1 Tax=Candidatus Kentrum sp. MB TaxID=2138164 RepID=A0A450XKB4_9GAMM|nr:MAG: hypothetical protein BECKMB1821G_GA0114241_105216 [Candidatus Kentron sp. MB]VFK76435.1 MAG: hypothetical protein BECKMB1821H_GA0114242_105616 [Candidatus Kentron sp. MB]
MDVDGLDWPFEWYSNHQFGIGVQKYEMTAARFP